LTFSAESYPKERTLIDVFFFSLEGNTVDSKTLKELIDLT
jgi:hypothetical protein